jgi:CRP/FNR family transcriptional regulator, cyclic AMP receptor protein
MTTDEIILRVLRNSTLTEELRNPEIELLASLFTVREYKAGDAILTPGNTELKDALMMLAVGDVEATATAGGEKMSLHLLEAGDLANIIGFTGGNVMQISATITAKADSKLLLLERTRFESLLNSNPAVVYYFMRGLVRNVHGIVRHMNMESIEMSNYVFKQGGRY